jgi:hypothetical protein
MIAPTVTDLDPINFLAAPRVVSCTEAARVQPGAPRRAAHFRAMLEMAKTRGFAPRYVAVDSWYSSLANLKAIRTQGWQWLARPKARRHVNPAGTGKM